MWWFNKYPKTIQLERSWEIGATGSALMIRVRLAPLPSEFRILGVSQHRLHVSISGLQNPCTGNDGYYIGFEAHNPAFALARNYIIASIESRLGDSLQIRKLYTSYDKQAGATNQRPAAFHFNSCDEMSLHLDFNPAEAFFRQPNYRAAKIKDLHGVFNDLTAAIDLAKPKAQAEITAHDHLQPNPDNAKDRLVQELIYERASRRAFGKFNQAMKEMGLPPNRQPGEGGRQ